MLFVIYGITIYSVSFHMDKGKKCESKAQTIFMIAIYTKQINL